jgi:DNA-binding transcriptional regulator YdaS (Cro superfamily)
MFIFGKPVTLRAIDSMQRYATLGCMDITAPQRVALAEKYHISERYLYQLLTGRRQMNAVAALEIEARTNGEIRRWHVRRNDWWQIWPELVDAPGAPEVPATA